jgi:phytoene dehydrogenase-like protein
LLRLGIGFGARLRAFRGMASIMWGANKTWTFAEWLRRRGQLGEPDQVMWRPLCRAVMNVEPEDASAAEFLASLREAFLGSAASAAFWLPKKPWGELLGDPALRAFENEGIKLRTGARVTELKFEGDRVVAIVLGDEVIEVGADDTVVSAMPWFALCKVLGDHEALTKAFGTLRSSPIVTAYFTMANQTPPDEGPVVALVGGQPFHFLLRTPGDPTAQFALLSGGNRSFDGKSVAEITKIAKQQLQRYYGSACTDDDAEVVIRKARPDQPRSSSHPSPTSEGYGTVPGTV